MELYNFILLIAFFPLPKSIKPKTKFFEEVRDNRANNRDNV